MRNLSHVDTAVFGLESRALFSCGRERLGWSIGYRSGYCPGSGGGGLPLRLG